jgi:2',3'-cyclic-nucleotide 2'-phosphodiesterase (5'-nucleotidase family)
MKQARCWSALCFLLFLAPAWAREVPITILHTTDLHGRVENLGRCATLIQQIRDSEKNVLLLDAGDTVQGSPESWLSGGLVMVKAMNALRYDAWVLGNHEFDWGLDKLTGCVARAEMPVLAANLDGMTGVRPYVIREVDGVKVGIVGLTTPGVPNWSRPRLIPGLKFADSLETLRRTLPAARQEGAEALVLVAHQGFKESGDDHANQVRAIASQFPELDVIIGGHTHREFGEFRVSGALYTQAGFHGQKLGRVDLVFDTEKGRVTSRRSRVLPADAAPVLLPREELEQAGRYMVMVIGEAAEDFTCRGAPKRETAIHNLLCEAIAAAVRKQGGRLDAVVHGVLDSGEKLLKGPVSIGDVWRIVPYENTIGVAQLTAADLREILEENAAVYEKREFRGVWGLRYRLDLHAAEGHRVLELRWPDGRQIGENERLAVAFNSYDLASGGLRWKKLREIAERPQAGLVEYDMSTREALVEWIRRCKVLKPRLEGWWEVEKTVRRKASSMAY